MLTMTSQHINDLKSFRGVEEGMMYDPREAKADLERALRGYFPDAVTILVGLSCRIGGAEIKNGDFVFLGAEGRWQAAEVSMFVDTIPPLPQVYSVLLARSILEVLDVCKGCKYAMDAGEQPRVLPTSCIKYASIHQRYPAYVLTLWPEAYSRGYIVAAA